MREEEAMATMLAWSFHLSGDWMRRPALLAKSFCGSNANYLVTKKKNPYLPLFTLPSAGAW